MTKEQELLCKIADAEESAYLRGVYGERIGELAGLFIGMLIGCGRTSDSAVDKALEEFSLSVKEGIECIRRDDPDMLKPAMLMMDILRGAK